MRLAMAIVLLLLQVFPASALLSAPEGAVTVIFNDHGRRTPLSRGFVAAEGMVALPIAAIRSTSAGQRLEVATAAGRTLPVDGTVAVSDDAGIGLVRVDGTLPPPIPRAKRLPPVGGKVTASTADGLVQGEIARAYGGEFRILLVLSSAPRDDGSPVMNEQGELIGMLMTEKKGGQTAATAIPLAVLEALLPTGR